MNYLDELRTEYPSLQDYSDDQIISNLPSINPEGYGKMSNTEIREKALFDPTEGMGDFKKGLISGAKNLQAIGGGLAGLAGEAVGSESLSDWGIDYYKEKSEEAGQYQGDTVEFDKIDSIGSAVDFAQYHLGSAITMFGPTIISGGAGGLLARGVAKKGIESFIEKEAATLVASGVAKESALKKATEIAIGQASKKAASGAAIGGAGASIGIESGSIFGDIEEKTGKREVWPTLIAGTVAGAVDVLPFMPVLKRIGGFPAKESLVKYVVDGLGPAAAKGMATEGVTEGFQTSIERLAVQWVDENQKAFSPEGWAEIRTGMAAGVVGGGPVIGAIHTLSGGPLRTQTETDENYQARIEAAKSDAKARGGNDIDAEIAGANAALDSPTSEPEWIAPQELDTQQVVYGEMPQMPSRDAPTGIDLDIAAAKDMGFIEEAIRLQVAKQSLAKAEEAEAAGDALTAGRYIDRYNTVINDVLGAGLGIVSRPGDNLPAIYEHQGQVVGGDLTVVDQPNFTMPETDLQGESQQVPTNRLADQSIVNRLEDSGTIYAGTDPVTPGDPTGQYEGVGASTIDRMAGNQPLIGRSNLPTALPDDVRFDASRFPDQADTASQMESDGVQWGSMGRSEELTPTTDSVEPAGVATTPVEPVVESAADIALAKENEKAVKRSKAAVERRQVNTDKDTLSTAVMKLGGLSFDIKMDVMGDTKGNKNIPDIGYVFSSNGTGLDDMAMLLHEQGFIPASEMENLGGVPYLTEMLGIELAGMGDTYAPGSKAEQNSLEADRESRLAEQVSADEAELVAMADRFEQEFGPIPNEVLADFIEGIKQYSEYDATQEGETDYDAIEQEFIAQAEKEEVYVAEEDGRQDEQDQSDEVGAGEFALGQEQDGVKAADTRKEFEAAEAKAKIDRETSLFALDQGESPEATTPVQADVEDGAEKTPAPVEVPLTEKEEDAPKAEKLTTKGTVLADKAVPPKALFSRAPSNLFVTHNISEEGVIAADELGGLAAPSLAIARADLDGFDSFGEISLLADPSILSSSKTRTFDADIYTPRQARAHHKVNFSALRAFNESLATPPKGVSLRQPDPDMMRDTGGMNAFARSEAVIYDYLDSVGKAPKLKKMKVSPAAVKASKLDSVPFSWQTDPAFMKIAEQEYRGIIESRSKGDAETKAELTALFFDGENGSLNHNLLRDFADTAQRYKRSDGADTGRFVRDLQKKLRVKSVQRDYDAYAKAKFESLIEGKLLYKGTSDITGRQKFADYTLANVVKDMTANLQSGESFFHGAGQVRSAYAKELKTLSAIKASRDKIVPNSEMAAIKDQASDVLFDALEKLKPFYKYSAESFGYSDDAAQAITEGRRGIREAFDVTPEVEQIVADLTEYLRALDTDYFEAKMQRAVQFEEFDTAVVPKGVNPESLKILKDAGLKVRYYDEKTEGKSRKEIVAKQERLLFSKQGRNYKTTPAVSTVAELNTELSPAIRRLDKAIKQRVKIVQTTSELPVDTPLDVRGMYYDGIAYVVADNTPVSDAKTVLTHELIGHMGLEELLGDSFHDVIGKVKHMKRVGNKQVADIIKTLEQNYTDADGNYALSANQEAREILAHIAEADQNHSLVKQLIAKLKLWLARVGLSNKDNAEIGQLIAQAARFIEGKGQVIVDGSGNLALNDTKGMSNEDQANRTTQGRQTSAQAINKAGGYEDLIAQAGPDLETLESSGAINDLEQGREITVLHRSGAEFNTFNDGKLGANSKHSTSKLGHFTSLSDVGFNKTYGKNLTTHKVQLKNVYTISEGDFADMVSLSDSEVEAMRTALMDAGVEGMAVTGLDWVIVFDGKNIKDGDKSYSREDTSIAAHKTAQRNAALPESEGGLGLPADSTAMDRAEAMGFDVENIIYSGTRGQAATRISSQSENPGLVFGGIFGSYDRSAAEAFGDTIQEFYTKNHIDADRANAEAIYGDNWQSWHESLRKRFDYEDMTDAELQELMSYVMEEKFIMEDAVPDMGIGRFAEILGKGEDDFGGMQWEIQAVKGYLAQDQGYTSVGMTDEMGESILVLPGSRRTDAAFDPMKSDSPELLFSRTNNIGGNTKWKDEPGYQDLPEGTFDSLGKFGKPPNPPLIDKAKERFAEIKPRFGTKLRQEVLDQYDSIKSVLDNKRAWMLAQLSGSTGGAIEMVIQEGGLQLHNDGVLQINTGMKGLAETLAPLGNESNRFLQWVAANRASRLWAEDKEHLLSEQDIQNLLDLNKNTTANPTREATYAAVLKDFEALHNSVVKVGVDTGLVSREDAALWKEQGFYVPFYRLAEEGGDSHGVSSVSGMVGQTAYKKLKGANMQLNDLLMNTVMNWEHIASASLKNQAAAATLETAVEMGLATRLNRKPTKVEKNHIFIRENGQEVWFHLDSTPEGKLVLQSISSLNYNGLDNAPMKVMRKFKRMLTIGVTASPQFKLSNAIRDTIQAIAVAPMSTNFLKNVHQGWNLTSEMSDERVQSIAAGGLFGDSGYINGGDPDAIRTVMSKHVSQAEILDTEHAIKKWWNKYQDFGARLENVNRIANIKQSLDADKDLLTSNFEGRDHLDFQRSGANIAVRVLTQSIPFLNARFQGLDKMARAFADPEQRRQTIAVIGAYSAASALLYLYMKDDEDYKEAEQWERDTYHMIKLPGSDKMIRIPRPFEVGALANIIERGVEQFADPDVDMSLYYERLQHMLTETLAFSIIPQALAPALDIRANKSSFTGRQIESMSMQRLSPANRIKPWTTQSAIGLSKLLSMPMGENGLSPIQIDFLVKQYTGWAGATVLNGLDLMARPALGEASRPEMKIQDYPVIGRFVREAKGRNSKYITELYDNKAFLAQKFADIKHYRASQEVDKLEAAMEKYGKDLRYRKMYNKASAQLSKLSTKIKRITDNKDLSPEEKSRRIDLINAKRLRIARLAVRRGKLESK